MVGDLILAGLAIGLASALLLAWRDLHRNAHPDCVWAPDRYQRAQAAGWTKDRSL